jgi:hypothetical protein
MAHCHCRSCRLAHGAAFVTWTSAPLERFACREGEDDIRWYRSSPQIRWGFCRHCGSSMFYVADAEGHPESPTVGHIYVSVACLTSEFEERPSGHVSWEERVAWNEASPDLPRFRSKTNERIP